ncbi:Fe2+-enterobactin ABC transporter substrate-binding protein [uncultured Microbacterium sp.]|uniref:Fe2+-enterobactin ABC transporter substrate-binding protein n=1 Tax=uncultured Microbacterium sp. TaxID=191216 RepID=UPI0026206C18|nr:Fe2+-enterobactin ABC transporter substrate-binding protein [uncultured Microbacterium sp.]
MRSRLISCTAIAAVSLTVLVGCTAAGIDSDADNGAATTDDASWPRIVEHDAGTTEIPGEPLRIVSVSPSITGSLLAIDAPVIATGAAYVSALTDDKGFFTQWADAADAAGVEVAYSDLELDLDAIDLLEPDLIVGSVNGADTALESYDQLSEIAPTILLDYGTETWQELTSQLGEATGREDAAETVFDDYDAQISELATELALPEQPVTVAVYLGADGVWAYDGTSPQADLLASLGFSYAPAAEEFSSEQAAANGVNVLSAENMAAGLADTQTMFLVNMTGTDVVAAFTGDALLAGQAAVAAGRVHSLGTESFRLDYYSALNTAKLLVDIFAG